MPYRPWADIEDLRDRRVREIAGYAAETVPHYRELWRAEGIDPRSLTTAADLDALPVLEKDEVRRDPDRFVSESPLGRASVPFLTSGTTGLRLRVHHDRRELLLTPRPLDRGGKSPEEADALFARIGRNARVVRGHTFLAQFMAAGEVAVAPNYALRAQDFADEGAPIAWKPVVEPLIVQPNGIGLVERTPHPAAALLFVDWLLSDGEELYAEGAGAEPVRRDLSLTAGTERRVVDFESLAADQQAWTDRFERLLALRREVEEDG